MDDVNFLIMLFTCWYLSVYAHKDSSQKIHNSSLYKFWKSRSHDFKIHHLNSFKCSTQSSWHRKYWEMWTVLSPTWKRPLIIYHLRRRGKWIRRLWRGSHGSQENGVWVDCPPLTPSLLPSLKSLATRLTLFWKCNMNWEEKIHMNMHDSHLVKRNLLFCLMSNFIHQILLCILIIRAISCKDLFYNGTCI